jgi:hypothetical protein
MPISSEKIHSSSNDCLVSRQHVQEKNNNVLYYIAAENSKLGKQYELFQLNLSACLTVGFVLQPPFLMPYFSLDKMRGDLQRTSERPIIVPKSLDGGWLHAACWQYGGCDGFWLILTFIPPPPHTHTYIISGILEFSAQFYETFDPLLVSDKHFLSLTEFDST